MNDKALQSALQSRGFYKGQIDGIIGPNTRNAINAFLDSGGITNRSRWSNTRTVIAAKQLVCRELGIEVGAIDGFMGPQTRYAFEVFSGKNTPIDRSPKPDDRLPVQSNRWPRQTESEMNAFYGRPGENHTMIDLPYTMKIAWNKKQKINRFVINSRCAESALRCFERVAATYDARQRADMGLDLFGGCFNHRKMRGGTQLSTHAFAIAIDFSPEENQLRWDASRARLAQPDAIPFWEIWESEGWVSLGRARNFDWQHVQACRL
jgi:hypothetical protein